MRILSNDIIIKAGVLIIIIIGLMFYNIYVAVCKKRSLFSMGINISSIFIGLYMFARFMQVVIIDLPIETFYTRLGNIFLCVGIITSILTGLYFVYKKINLSESIFLQPDTSSLFSAINDPIVIYDNNNHLLSIHKDELLLNLKSTQIYKLEDLISIISKFIISTGVDNVASDSMNTNSTKEYEIYDEENDGYYQMIIAPIMASKEDKIGTIIRFHNISEEKKLLMEIDKQNSLLENANQKIEAYVEVANELELEKERLRLLGEIQSELIIRIDKVVNNLKEIQSYKAIYEIDNKDIQAIGDELRSILNTIRKSVNNISTKRGAV